MTRRELAGWLCENVHQRRLARIGEPDSPLDGLGDLPPAEQENWLDLADAVLAFNSEADAISRLQSLGTDWLRYTMQLGHDRAWRDEMRRAVVVEMRVEVEKLAAECGLSQGAL